MAGKPRSTVIDSSAFSLTACCAEGITGVAGCRCPRYVSARTRLSGRHYGWMSLIGLTMSAVTVSSTIAPPMTITTLVTALSFV